MGLALCDSLVETSWSTTAERVREREFGSAGFLARLESIPCSSAATSMLIVKAQLAYKSPKDQ